MAILHHASLVPSKAVLVEAWLPTRPWAPSAPIKSGVSYRLDDPEGQVGMEGFLLTDVDGLTVHVPLTYRGAPLHAAQAHLLGTMEHSVLGTRWVYDGCADPVWATTLASTITTGGTQAEELFVGDDPEQREPSVTVRGSGTAGETVAASGPWTTIDNDTMSTVTSRTVELVVVRRVGTDPQCPQTLAATWDNGARSGLLAGLRLA